MTRAELAEILPALAEAVAADTGRSPAEVAERLAEAFRARPEDVDVDGLVELLGPTVTRVIGPALLPLLERLERIPAEERLPVIAPIVVGLLPALVLGVTIGREARG